MCVRYVFTLVISGTHYIKDVPNNQRPDIYSVPHIILKLDIEQHNT